MGKLLSFFLIKLPVALTDVLERLRVVTEPLLLALLILLGVHSAVDLLDDVVFATIDTLDRGVDALVMGLLGWLGERDILRPDKAAAYSDGFALLLDIDRKEVVSVVLALATELMMDVILLLWCLPGAQLTPAEPAPSDESTTLKLRRALGRGWMLLPGTLRGVAVVVGFLLGAFVIGRWTTGQAARLLARPLFGAGAPALAPLAGTIVGGLVLLLLLPLALKRAQVRVRSQAGGRWIRAVLLPLAIATLLSGALITGGPGRAAARLWSDHGPASAPASVPGSTDGGAGSEDGGGEDGGTP